MYLDLIDELADRRWKSFKATLGTWHLYYDRRKILCRLVVGALGVMLRWYGNRYEKDDVFYVSVKMVRDSGEGFHRAIRVEFKGCTRREFCTRMKIFQNSNPFEVGIVSTCQPYGWKLYTKEAY